MLCDNVVLKKGQKNVQYKQDLIMIELIKWKPVLLVHVSPRLYLNKGKELKLYIYTLTTLYLGYQRSVVHPSGS